VRIKNTSQYPDSEVRELVTFAMKGIDTTGVMVNVKDSRHAYRGMAYHGIPSMSPAAKMRSVDRLITIGIGGSHKFPTDNMIRNKMRWQKVSDEDVQAMDPVRRGLVRWTSYSDGRWQAHFHVLMEPHPYGGKRSPLIEHADWREALVAVSAHEARHHYQMSHGKSLSEVDAEKHAAKALDRYRSR